MMEKKQILKYTIQEASKHPRRSRRETLDLFPSTEKYHLKPQPKLVVLLLVDIFSRKSRHKLEKNLITITRGRVSQRAV